MKNDLNSVRVPAGRYILAVSGGVDSMVLLDLLAKQPAVELVVAHFNHGIRPDSNRDEELVAKAAKRYGLVSETGQGNLGASASEDMARRVRYGFLEETRRKHGAKTVITAHHQDDLIETAIMNMLRGSGRRGLSAIKDNPRVLRPLIETPKASLRAYAKAHKLVWREDSTNTNPKYLRNYVRLQITPKLTNIQRTELLKNIDKVAKNRNELESLIATLSHNIRQNHTIDRSKFVVLPAELSGELMAYWLREQGMSQFDRKMVEKLSIGLKTARSGSEIVINKQNKLVMSAKAAHFSNR